jgi:integrase
MAKLTETKIKALRPRERAYKAFDAHGLYVLVPPSGSLLWRVRLSRDDKEQHLSLGRYPEVGLDDARARAAQLRARLKNGDAATTATLAAELRGAARPHPVRVAPAGDELERVAERWQEDWVKAENLSRKTTVRNDRCFGYLIHELGPRTPIGAIDTPMLQEATERIERTHGRETAHRTLALANKFWRFAMAKRLVSNNPASGLKATEILAPSSERHYAAIIEPRTFGALLRAIDGYAGQPVTRLALQLLALTFVRPGELRLATWGEFTLEGDAPQWDIPRARTKMRESNHVVPLSAQAVSLLRELERHRRGELTFPSLRDGRPLSDNTFNVALRTLGFSNDVHVAHGFRSSAASLLHGLGFDSELVETQLAHARPGVRGVYFRAHLLEQRREMLQRWADYLDGLRKEKANDQ